MTDRRLIAPTLSAAAFMGLGIISLVSARVAEPEGSRSSRGATYYVVPHFHYSVLILALFAGLALAYVALIRIWHVAYSPALSALQVVIAFIGVLVLFSPAFILRFGIGGPDVVEASDLFPLLNRISMVGYGLLGLGLALFPIVLLDGVRRGSPVRGGDA